MNYRQVASSLLIATFVTACKVNIVVPAGGEVSSVSGTHRCAANSSCTLDVSHTAFDETFNAVPASGYVFKGWRKSNGYFCGGSNKPCRLATSGFSGNSALMHLLQSDRNFYLEPVFESSAKYSLSGTIRALNTASLDSDINDDSARNVPNNTLATAQVIANPTTLGGYVNVASAGEKGLTYTIGDSDDYFAIDLLKGQKINLVIATPNTADLDLYLYDSAGNVVSYSLESGRIEALTVPATGRYFINVNAFSGGSNYNLSVGQTTSAQVFGQGFNASADFEIGHAMVQYQRRVTVSSASSQQRLTNSEPASLPHRVALNSPAGAKTGINSNSASTPNKSYRIQKQQRKFASSELEQKWRTLMQIKQLAARGDVQYAVPNFRRKPSTVTPNDTYYASQWHYPMINLPKAWGITTGSASVIVAVLDTGVLLNHPDLQGQLVAGYDFISDISTAADGDGIDSNPDDPGDSEGGEPSSFHGTHVAGTIAAATNNQTGVAGVAWGARIMPIRVLGKGGGYDSDIAEGIKYAAGLSNASGRVPAQKAAIINMSLGGEGYSQAMQDIINSAVAAGVIVVAASGNDGSQQPAYPASYDNVISVSAVGPNSQITSYSNYGAYIDVAAPGGDVSIDSNGDGWADGVLSAAGEGENNRISFNYMRYEGTSMAAPHVAGVIALMKSINSALTSSDIDKLLRSGAITVDRGPGGRDDKYGYGVIDAFKAVRAARDGETGGNATPPQLQVSPRQIGLTAGQSQVLFISNSGGGTLQVQRVIARDNWLKVDMLDSSGNAVRYQISLSSSLPTGTYQTTIDVVSTAGTLRIPVLASVVSTGTVQTGVGTVYLVLHAKNDRTVNVAETAIEVDSAGNYRFNFNDIPAGHYYLLAGTDMNNDYFICDAGEACGSYPTSNTPVAVELNRNRSNIDFAVSFDSGISAQAVDNETGKAKKGTPVRK